jgi:hypothetical protein
MRKAKQPIIEAVTWPIAKRYGGWRDSKTHLTEKDTVLCTGYKLSGYFMKRQVPVAGACKNCMRILNKRLSQCQ